MELIQTAAVFAVLFVQVKAEEKLVVVVDDLVLDNYIHIDIVDVVDIHNWVEVVVVD